MKMSKVWEILTKFKNCCRFRGWKASENEDWIEMGSKYHNFLYAKCVHPSSLKSIVSNRKCVIQEGLSYRVVDASYTALLLSEAPIETLVETIFETPESSSRIAIYDLGPLLEGKNLCVRLNQTDSPVFQEFDNFLKDELKVELKPLLPSSGMEIAGKDCTIEELV